ncbi:YesL family protein [Domibacillus indicus]|uniref:YesL family protein n=1 Tax=Domibacillus indicus TaxID=1437523 RepID=UPI000617E739|nr:DUF624 domain-containing protein [Domibacillus indicus]
MGRMAEKANSFCSLILKLVYVHLLWLAFTLMGLVIFGAGPAAIAMFGVVRQWIRGNEDIPIFQTFKELYKLHFKEGNLLLFFYGLAGWILYIDLLYVQSFAIRAVVITVGILYLVSIFYVPCIVVHYEMKTLLKKIKYAVFLGIAYFQYTLVLLVALSAAAVLLMINPGFFFVFGLSPIIYITMWMVHQVFQKAEKEQSNNESRLAIDKQRG